ncbi:hypothetical protein AB4865_10565 [Capnocytophaga sp. ARDL2]|uniref:hypothetical protein n=1 Tax=Capnocytophaga sp. ARDL2 TaxID=3238809 RepID=UPI003556D581
MWEYLQFLWKSTNEHGVHSPFVFQFLTRGIYDFPLKKQYVHPRERLLQSAVYYFQPKTIFTTSNSFPYKLNVLTSNDILSSDFIIYYEENNRLTIDEILEQLTPHQLLWIVPTDNRKNILSKAKKNPTITLTVDFFHGILVSKRTEQLKQTFYLRSFRYFGDFKI